tara:strand:- start:573 stop:1226 length:654 start_codon:yes stop_codon:yes gene_type:complete
MKIACITYRDWALKIYDRLHEAYEDVHNFMIIKSREEYNKEEILLFNPDLILWYGWSWIVDREFTSNFTSIMLHPSPLPKYRGGSPIQNQIINNEKTSSVTLFKMTENIDDGDVYVQLRMSLSGSLNNIFTRMTNLGFAGTCQIIDGDAKLTKQDKQSASYFKRRKPENSEITIDEIKNKSAEYIHNKIRMLADPYPNAFIRTKDNKKLLIIESKIE